MKRGSTLFLKIIISLLGGFVLTMCVGISAEMIGEGTALYHPVFLGMYGTAIPFFIGIYQTFKLLRYIDKNNAFSDLSVKALQNIKYCAALISVLYGAALPLLYAVAQREDAPGVLAIGIVFALAAAAVAVIAAVLQKLLQNAIDIKSENDLTV
jgi:hypothetical protein